MIATSPTDVLRFVVDRRAAARESVVVTLVGIEGATSRAVGHQMAVASDQSRIGSFSGGCIEAAVAAEALRVLETGKGRIVRYGVGSPFFDIRLPCGGGIDLLFTPRPCPTTVAEALDGLDRRRAVALRFDEIGVTRARPAAGTVVDGGGLVVGYRPRLRLVAVGRGEDLTALARLAHRFGCDVEAVTPDDADRRALELDGIAATSLRRGQLPADVVVDASTAIAVLFHGREWEEPLLPEVLLLPAFWIGAIGSRNGRALRLAALHRAGIPQAAIDRLRGPVGLIPSTRDPATLAVSILADIAAADHAIRHDGGGPDALPIDR